MPISSRHGLLLLTALFSIAAWQTSAQSDVRAWLGVTVTDATREHLQDNGGGDGGSYVMVVEGAGPASTAGILRQDIIVAVDGQTAINSLELMCLLQARRPGEAVLITLVRGGQRHAVTAKLARWPERVGGLPPPPLYDCGRREISSR